MWYVCVCVLCACLYNSSRTLHQGHHQRTDWTKVRGNNHQHSSLYYTAEAVFSLYRCWWPVSLPLWVPRGTGWGKSGVPLPHYPLQSAPTTPIQRGRGHGTVCPTPTIPTHASRSVPLSLPLPLSFGLVFVVQGMSSQPQNPYLH